jgi:two-component system phosphate regulon response regulator PhoB
MLPPSSLEPTKAPKWPTVLCIDDDPLVLRFYRNPFDTHGYRVLTTTEGLDDLAMAHQDRPDVILLDVMLRGLSGFDVCRKFRAAPALRDIPIILLTVLHNAGVPGTGQEARATLTLHKHADAEEIVTAIEQVLRKRRHPPREGA